MRNKQQDNKRFWLVSAALHLLAFLVFFFTPAGQRVFEQKDREAKPEVIRKDEELAQVVDQVRALAVGRLKTQVAAIGEVSTLMEAHLATTADRYEGFLGDQIASAAERFTEEAETTLRAQSELLAAIKEFDQTPDTSAVPLRDTFNAKRSGIVSGLEEIRRALLLVPAAPAELVAQFEATEDAQFDVFEKIAHTIDARQDQLKLTRERETLLAEKAELEPLVEFNVQRLAEVREEAKPYREQKDILGRERNRMRDRRGGAQKKLGDRDPSDPAYSHLKEALDAAQANESAARDAYNANEEQLQKLYAESRQFQKKVENQEKRLPFIAKRVPELEVAIPKYKASADEKSADVLKLQEKVHTDMEAITKQLLPLLENLTTPDENGSRTPETEVTP